VLSIEGSTVISCADKEFIVKNIIAIKIFMQTPKSIDQYVDSLSVEYILGFNFSDLVSKIVLLSSDLE
jgi:hypothetical protein